MGVRQSTKEVQFDRTTRPDYVSGGTSGRAGVVLPITYIPLFRGDSCAGAFTAEVDMAEMPRPLRNRVYCNFQAWFVPKSAHPQFSGYDEFMHAYQGEQIKALGFADRAPPSFFLTLSGADLTTYMNSTFLSTLGKHAGAMSTLGNNTDLVDAYSLIWNFRAAAHSSKIARRSYATEDTAAAVALAPAFWPTNRFPNLVPDYERALVLGNLDLDVTAGSLPVTGMGADSGTNLGDVGTNTAGVKEAGGGVVQYDANAHSAINWSNAASRFYMEEDPDNPGHPNLFAQMAGQVVGTSLASVDKARTSQAMAKLHSTLAGNDATGFDNDDAIVAELMQGFSVPHEQFKRPWLLDSKRVRLGLSERHATDAANLEDSVTTGYAAARLSLNVPRQEVGGIIMITCEVLPEQFHERQGDPFLYIDDVNELPNALRDIQREEPVDIVPNWRIDAAHTTPEGGYGFEPMNEKWSRNMTTLGGKYYQPTPGTPTNTSRAGFWLVDVVDPLFTDDHYLAPDNFPHNVFSDLTGDAVEISFVSDCRIRGITQKGDMLVEANDDYAAVTA